MAHLEGRIEREYGPAHSHRAVSAAAASVDANQQVDDPAIFDMLESFIKKTQDEYSQHSVLPSFESGAADASTGLPTKAAAAKPKSAVNIGQDISYEEESEESDPHTSEDFDSSYQPNNRHSSGPGQYQKPGKYNKPGKSDSETYESDQDYEKSDKKREKYIEKDSSDTDGQQQEEEQEEEGEENFFGQDQGKEYAGKAPGSEYGGKGKGKKAHIPVPKDLRPGRCEMVTVEAIDRPASARGEGGAGPAAFFNQGSCPAGMA